MSRERKYSDEFRLKLVEEYLSGNSGGVKTIAKKHNVAYSALRRWINLYKQHGAEGLSNSPGTYSGEFKIHVVEYMHANGLSLVQTANLFCIPSHPTVGKWERIYYEEGPEALLEERQRRKNM